MSKSVKETLSKVKETLLSMKVKLERAETPNGKMVEYESLEEGNELWVITDDGKELISDGEHEINGNVVSTEDGIIQSVDEAQEDEDADEVEESEDEMNSVELNSGDVAKYEGELDIGTELFISGEPAEDGYHELSTGDLLQVSEGKVEDILKLIEEFAKVQEKLSSVKETNKTLTEDYKELKESFNKLVESHKEAVELIGQISEQPAVEEEEKKTVNNFNKTKSKSRALQIISS